MLKGCATRRQPLRCDTMRCDVMRYDGGLQKTTTDGKEANRQRAGRRCGPVLRGRPWRGKEALLDLRGLRHTRLNEQANKQIKCVRVCVKVTKLYTSKASCLDASGRGGNSVTQRRKKLPHIKTPNSRDNKCSLESTPAQGVRLVAGAGVRVKGVWQGVLLHKVSLRAQKR